MRIVLGFAITLIIGHHHDVIIGRVVIILLGTTFTERGIILHHVDIRLEITVLDIHTGALLIAGDGAVAAYDDTIELVVFFQIIIVEIGEGEERRECHGLALLVDRRIVKGV